MNNIHSTAIVSKKAKLGDNIEIAPFVIINDDVEIGDNCFIGPYVTINDGARLGNGVNLYQGASISHIPQHKKYANEPTLCIIGDNSIVHEFASVHRGTESGKTVLGKSVLLMAYAHIAHDCRLGDHVIISNACQLAGYTEVEEWAIVGGCIPIHQFTRIGRHSIIGDGYKVGRDVLPYTLAAGEPLGYYGLNKVGLKRRNFTEEQIQEIKQVLSVIYDPNLNVTQAKEKLVNEYANNPFTNEFIEFINKSKRGIITR